MEWLKILIATVIPPLKVFSFARMVWFASFVWYFLFMIVLSRISWTQNIKIAICLAAFFAICLSPSIYNHVLWNSIAAVKKVTGKEQTIELSGMTRIYYPIGNSILQNYLIGLKAILDTWVSDRSVAYGMHPAILNYNGIATLDGYLSYYPKEYKDQFRKLIKPELEVDVGHEEYYESYGGRAYIFSEDVSYTPYRTSDITEAVMLIDSDVFREMGGKFVFSRVRITNFDELQLQKLGIYEDEESPYTIYVYKTRRNYHKPGF